MATFSFPPYWGMDGHMAEEEIHAVLENLTAQNHALAAIQQSPLELVSKRGNNMTTPVSNSTF